MNDIFISYDRHDRARAQKFADALESLGWSVWWDREIPLGKSFDQVIEEELNSARCVVVLWSSESVKSRWVKTEASAAIDRGCLVPVFIDRVTSPLEFRLIQAAELWDWDGDTTDPEFGRLVLAVREMLGQVKPIGQVRAKAPNSPKPTVRATPRFLGAVAAAVIVIGILMLARTTFQNLRGIASQSTVDTGAASIPSATTADGKAIPPEGAFSINIGDRIDDGIPGQGAGSIEKPYEQDHYVFTAQPGQRVYFRMLRHSTGMSYMNWQLSDETGMKVFDVCFGCTEPGVQILTRGGLYTLTVGAENDPATGTYQLQLFAVPAPSQFSLKIGDAIEQDKPGPGAGVIESPGAEDVYRFTAAPRQSVYFRMVEHSTGMAYINWRLAEDDGMELFNACLGCTEPGLQTLIKGGTYVLTLGRKTDPSTGLYRLRLFNVPPPQQFTIKIGDKVGPGSPGAGAGAIEGPGAEDVYVFTATPGQRAYFRMAERSTGMEYLNWRLVDDNGMKLFDACLACTEPGAQTLVRGGKYTLTVGSRTNPSTGNYAFEVGSR